MGWRELAGPAAIYLACTALFFGAALRDFRGSIIGAANDGFQYVWVLWSASKGPELGSPELTWSDAIFQPEGGSLLYNDSSWYNLILGAPLASVLGAPAAYNLLLLSTFPLSALAAFLLLRHVVRDFPSAVVGGFVFGFSPAHFAHSLHHLSLSTMQFIPLFVLFFLKATGGGSKLDRAMAAVFLGLNGLCNWNYLVFSLAFMSCGYAYRAWRERRWLLADLARTIAVISSGAGVLLLPVLGPMLMVTAAHYGDTISGWASGGHSDYIADLTGFVVPTEHHILGHLGALRELRASWRGNPWEAAVYLGLGNLTVLVLAARRGASLPRSWILGLLVCLVLALGTHLTIAGQPLPIPLPYEVMRHVPLLTNVRCPARWMILGYLFLAVVVAAALRELRTGGAGVRLGRGAWGVVVMVILLDYGAVCRESAPLRLPPVYEVIRRDATGFSILDLPNEFRANERYMAYQTMHHLPIVGGVVSRKLGRTLQDKLRLDDLSALGAQLEAHGVRYIVFHKSLTNQHPWVDADALRAAFPTAYEDKTQLLLRVGLDDQRHCGVTVHTRGSASVRLHR